MIRTSMLTERWLTYFRHPARSSCPPTGSRRGPGSCAQAGPLRAQIESSALLGVGRAHRAPAESPVGTDDSSCPRASTFDSVGQLRSEGEAPRRRSTRVPRGVIARHLLSPTAYSESAPLAHRPQRNSSKTAPAACRPALAGEDRAARFQAYLDPRDEHDRRAGAGRERNRASRRTRPSRPGRRKPGPPISKRCCSHVAHRVFPSTSTSDRDARRGAGPLGPTAIVPWTVT